MRYWSAFIDGESRSVWMRRLFLGRGWAVNDKHGLLQHLLMTLIVMRCRESCKETLWNEVLLCLKLCNCRTFCTYLKSELNLVQLMLTALFYYSPACSHSLISLVPWSKGGLAAGTGLLTVCRRQQCDTGLVLTNAPTWPEPRKTARPSLIYCCAVQDLSDCCQVKDHNFTVQNINI